MTRERRLKLLRKKQLELELIAKNKRNVKQIRYIAKLKQERPEEHKSLQMAKRYYCILEFTMNGGLISLYRKEVKSQLELKNKIQEFKSLVCNFKYEVNIILNPNRKWKTKKEAKEVIFYF